MKRLLRDLSLILALSGLWAIGDYGVGIAIETMGINYLLGVMFAALNLILGLSLFLGITRDSTANRIFFEGPRPDEGGRFAIGCLWMMPLSLLLCGLWLWLWVIIIRFILK